MQFILKGLIFVYPSCSDMRRRCFDVRPCMLCAALVLVIQYMQGQLDIRSAVLGAIPGILLSVISYVSQGAVGMGDALLILCFGLYAGFGQSMSVLFLAVILAGLTGLFLLFIHKAGRKTGMPFVPFLAAAYIGEYCIGKIC